MSDNAHGREANRAALERAQESGFVTETQVYEPHKIGLPKMVPYFTEVWRRREFAAELSSSEMRATNTRTFFGQIWLVLNPLLLASVYFILVMILRGGGAGLDFFAHLTAGLFSFYFISSAITNGAKSVVSSGSLIANISFPRLLMPLAAVRTSWFRFLPPLAVYLLIHLATGQPWRWTQLLSGYFIACMLICAVGFAAAFATFQVYFRDTMSFLPYVLRIWLYLSPILWYVEEVPARMAPFIQLNPLYSIIGGFTDLMVRGTIPPTSIWIAAPLWSIAFAVIGTLFFMSREREFAVRL